ncbi:metal-sulfur cluster assembly factor [Gorillibacterium massiliense]|uniref:metal-sulfur cluster assembly factor n=1 Tax=Gorillibacterium massiliense TaxID=1280390 RepID=UPI0004B0B5C5|nr:iron-sulfur cluster assembly protein [Gorillibacterium massiliense]
MELELKDAVWDILRTVYDPELGLNIVDLGLVYELQIEEGKVFIRMTLTTPGCPLHDTIVGGVKRSLNGYPGVSSVEVDLVWEPAWTPERMSDKAKEQLGFF